MEMHMIFGWLFSRIMTKKFSVSNFEIGLDDFHYTVTIFSDSSTFSCLYYNMIVLIVSSLVVIFHGSIVLMILSVSSGLLLSVIITI